MAEIALRHITKSYGSLTAVDDVSLSIGNGEFVTLLGASGSGKTTCLRIVAGFVESDSGQVLFDGADATSVHASRRNTGMVFQHYALFPHLTVGENIAYGLKVRRLPKAEISQRVEESLRLVQLEDFGDRYPAQLSGGQKQRVALARAVIIRPAVLLLDEPLSALDVKLRGELQTEIRRIQQTLKITTLFVTHDQGEALGMSDRIAVMRHGKVLQFDTPVNLYRQPASRYVANFIGTTNILAATVIGRGEEGGAPSYRLRLRHDPLKSVTVLPGSGTPPFVEGEACLLCFRPENAHLGGHDNNAIEAKIARTTYVGERWVTDCRLADDSHITIHLPSKGGAPAIGDPVSVGWSSDGVMLLKAEEGGPA